LQPRLDALNQLASADQREAALNEILQTGDYQMVWGTRRAGRAGFPANIPSRASFEAMVRWAARTRIPIIGLDVSLSDRANGLGENIRYRNELWKSRIEDFMERNHQKKYLVVVIAGVNHISNSPDSVPSKLKTNAQDGRVISVGQRDAMYDFQSTAKVEELAKTLALGDLIVRHPQFAIAGSDGESEFPNPPDYWIAAHAPDTWG
jgi:hypothetical protein